MDTQPMTQEEKRIKIAEACGWVKRTTQKWENLWMNPYTKWSEPEPPDYFNDLNSMHEAEFLVGLHNNDFKGRKLRRIWKTAIGLDNPCFATADQRAEAFGKTLKLW